MKEMIYRGTWDVSVMNRIPYLPVYDVWHYDVIIAVGVGNGETLKQNRKSRTIVHVCKDWWLCHVTSSCGVLPLTLTVLNFWKFTSYCSLKPLWSGMGKLVPARTSPTLHPPSPSTVHQLSRLALEELITDIISANFSFYTADANPAVMGT